MWIFLKKPIPHGALFWFELSAPTNWFLCHLNSQWDFVCFWWCRLEWRSRFKKESGFVVNKQMMTTTKNQEKIQCRKLRKRNYMRCVWCVGVCWVVSIFKYLDLRCVFNKHRRNIRCYYCVHVLALWMITKSHANVCLFLWCSMFCAFEHFWAIQFWNYVRCESSNWNRSSRSKFRHCRLNFQNNQKWEKTYCSSVIRHQKGRTNDRKQNIDEWLERSWLSTFIHLFSSANRLTVNALQWATAQSLLPDIHFKFVAVLRTIYRPLDTRPK